MEAAKTWTGRALHEKDAERRAERTAEGRGWEVVQLGDAEHLDSDVYQVEMLVEELA